VVFLGLGGATFALPGRVRLFSGGYRDSAESRTSLAAEATGRTRAPQKPPGIWFMKPDKVWPPSPDEFKYGWNSELGKWQDLPNDMILKWWQQPGYLTPNGYKRPPMWSKKTYAIACEEMRLGYVEAMYVADLKRRGLSIEEIRAKANIYEFIENPKKKPMTDKMRFLMQVKMLHAGKEDELIDIEEEEKREYDEWLARR